MEFTKEQLIEHVEGVINTFMEAVELYPDNAGMKMDLRTAEIALAAIKAEPVPGLFIKCTEIEPFPGKVTITQATPMENGKYHESCFQLYAAPPAPVAVPDEREAFNAWNNDTDCPLAGRDAKTAAWLAWSRRAAMLQANAKNDESPICD